MCRTIARPSPALPPSSSRLALAGARSVDLVEALEDPLLVRLRHADAVVGDREPDPIVERLPADPHLAAGMAVLHRVVGQVEERLAEPAGIGQARGSPVLGARQAAARGTSRRSATGPMRATHVGHDLLGVERLERQLRLARLDHRQVEQLVDELGEVVGLALDLGREVAHGRGVVDRAGASASRPAA